MADLIFNPDGTVRGILATPERADERVRATIDALGANVVERASNVVQRPDGQYEARMVAGPVLGPYATRDAALDAEVRYLRLTLSHT